MMTRSQCKSRGSFFERLPAEVFDMILHRLSVLEMSVFSMVSKAMSIYIVNHISTLAWTKRMVPQNFHLSRCPHDSQSTHQHYKALGKHGRFGDICDVEKPQSSLLFKRCTLLLPTKDRLKFIFNKFSKVPCFMMQCKPTAVSCLGVSSYGVFLQVQTHINRHKTIPIPLKMLPLFNNTYITFIICFIFCITFEQNILADNTTNIICYKYLSNFDVISMAFKTLIAGWNELECHRVFIFLCDFTNLTRKIEIVVNGKPGASQYLELQIRQFCRQVLLDPWPSRGLCGDCVFWLTQILKPWPMVTQARLLFVLYGPLLADGTLGWQQLTSSGLSSSALSDLAKAVLMLHTNSKLNDWSTNTILAILEELRVLPQVWHVENVARLLVQCGTTLCYSVLANEAHNGRLFEISRLLVYLILVCEKDGYCMSWVVRLVQQVCKVFTTAADKWSFIQSLESAFSEVTVEMYEVSLAGNPQEDLERFQTMCTILGSSAHFHTEILHMFLKDSAASTGEGPLGSPSALEAALKAHPASSSCGVVVRDKEVESCRLEASQIRLGVKGYTLLPCYRITQTATSTSCFLSRHVMRRLGRTKWYQGAALIRLQPRLQNTAWVLCYDFNLSLKTRTSICLRSTGK
ncbi:F-box only protein 47 [Merluccius polli]|uniref:F-box only protein 47 n=1 Tax=Merluccius polli TaxID=89951 RepID=A0AA47MH78_MERPO|nr:F-box only protein 47 [Merluccius polli]